MADLDTLRTALGVSPDNIPLLLLFAQTALDEWSTEDARQAYSRVLKIDPSHGEAGLGLARTFFQEGKPSEAIPIREDFTTKCSPILESRSTDLHGCRLS